MTVPASHRAGVSVASPRTRSRVPPPGIYVPTVTFFTPDDTLDVGATAHHALRMARGGMAGIVVQGTNGEAVHLDAKERQLAISTTRRALDDGGFAHVPIIAGTGQMSLKETLQTTHEAHAAGAEFALVIAPHYWPGNMTKPVLIEYFTKLADQSPVPIIVYNFPGVTAGIDFDSHTLITLAQHPNIVGAKFTCGNVGKVHRVAAHTTKDEFAAIGGKSDFLIHGLLAGSTGAVCGLCNLFPKVHVDCYNKYTTGDIKGALALQDLLADADSVGPKTGGIPGLKTAVRKYYGYGSSAVRSPFAEVKEERLEVAAELLGKLYALEQAL